MNSDIFEERLTSVKMVHHSLRRLLLSLLQLLASIGQSDTDYPNRGELVRITMKENRQECLE